MRIAGITQLDKRKRIPARSEVHTVICRSFAQGRKDTVCSNTSKPVGGVAGIGFLPMHDAVPECSFRGFNRLRDGVRFLQAREIKIQTAHRSLGRSRASEEIA